MADDQEQRSLEVVKLRIAFLQHITTLSGAAILIILALIQRSDAALQPLLLEITAATFVVAALISVLGVLFLITDVEPEFQIRGTRGRFTTALAGATFATGII